jgi:HTH-type transcriptional regulator/antitoxin HigA
MTSFRRSPSFKPDMTATTLWLRAGQRAAATIDAELYDQKALLSAIDEIRSFTQLEPADALSLVQARLAEVGVAVVLVAEFDKCRASGATWWASPSKAVIVLSNRGKREDRLWFSLFHELGHVLHHAKRDTFIDSTGAEEETDGPPWAEPAPVSVLIDDGSRDSVLEQEADHFASVALIPDPWPAKIVTLATPKQVIDMAKEIGVSAGVVAGRFQFETGDFTKFNKLRRTVPHELFLAPV